jgi:hypothetical protein
MLKFTFTTTKPSRDIPWPFEAVSGNTKPNRKEKYPNTFVEESLGVESEDGLTITKVMIFTDDHEWDHSDTDQERMARIHAYEEANGITKNTKIETI